MGFTNGLFGQAFQGGSNKRVFIPDDPAFGLTNFTIGAWVNIYADSYIIFCRMSGSQVAYAMGDNFHGSVGMNIGLAGDSLYAPITYNQWHQVTDIFDASLGTMSVYIDGTLAAQKSTTVTPLQILSPGSGTGLGIGNNTLYDFPLLGAIEEVVLYSRALSAAEVASLASRVCIPHPATATATLDYGFVVNATITDGGCGYTNTPLVSIQGGGGNGATATAVVSNGVVVHIIITDAGIGYTNTPTVLIGFAPSITSQPQSTTVNGGGNASFNAAAAGFPLNYQWSFNGSNISGATSSSLTISNVVPTNLGTYVVVVTNAFGSMTSSNAILSMYPYIESPFTGLVTDWGYTNTLSVGAWGTGPLSYQWFQNGVAVLNATNQALTLTSIQFTDAGLYSVVVSSPLGSVTNAPAQVVVNPAGVSLGLYPGVTISGVVGYHYMIESTADLSNTNSWITNANLILAQPVQLWVDTNVDASLPTHPRRFYQVQPGQ